MCACTIKILQNFIIPEAYSFEATLMKVCIAFLIKLRTGMLTTVDLDNQPSLQANKVENVMIKWHLPLEFQTVQPPATNYLPKHIFRQSRVFTHVACEVANSE